MDDVMTGLQFERISPDADEYHALAQECRDEAARISDTEMKFELLEIARHWQLLAHQLDRLRR